MNKQSLILTNARNKLLVICGPTATGKTSLGIKLAKKYNGEIVSADSRQVYRYMDIGTGKDLPLNTKYKDYRLGYYLFDKVPVWLLDIATPDFKFSVADYVKCASVVINDIWKRGKLPILVGGTGFYIKAIIDGVETIGIPQDEKLRQKLSNCQIVKLSNLLKKLDPERLERMNQSDRKNPRRLVRAIEIALQILNPKSQILDKFQIPNSKFQTKNTLLIGLKAPNKVLYERIDKRVEERVKQGVIKEIKGLLAKGYSWENSMMGMTMGYQEWQPYFVSNFKLQTSSFKEQVIQKWKYDEHGYARRQMTWFRKDKRVNWFDITDKKWQAKVAILVEGWYSKNTCRKK